MKKSIFNISSLSLALAFLLSSCKTESTPWQAFMACADNTCVDEVVAVKDAFLKDPKPIFAEFVKTDERGEDYYIGWLYLLRDSVLVNSARGTTEERFAMQQAILDTCKAYANDPKFGDFAKSIITELEMLAIASELEDDIPEYLPITGTYTYELPKEAGSGELKILANIDNTVRFSLMVVGAPPAYNQGTMDGTATLVGDMATITTTEYSGKCTITLTFSDGQVVAKTLAGGDAECGFGHNITADGTYKMVDDLDPFRAEGGDEVPENIVGDWQSTEDAKSEVKIEGGQYIDIYDGKEVSNVAFSYHKVCPEDCGPAGKEPCIRTIGQDFVCYTVIFADGKTLQLSMIGGRGNTLSFKRKK
ncbi:MAG: hypothetical protein HY842_10450 [Bacteroidetes bacterium]|nr:hypothetical protein [Bacteroidota bacterium]